MRWRRLQSIFYGIWVLGLLLGLISFFLYVIEERMANSGLQTYEQIAQRQKQIMHQIPAMFDFNERFVQRWKRNRANNNTDCPWRTLIITPIKQRMYHLRIFLRAMDRFLMRDQQHCTAFFVAMQSGDTIFNKGRLFNGAFVEVLEHFKQSFDCFIFHDVDLLPLAVTNRTLYSCTVYPKHLSVAIDKFNYRLPYASLIGGVLAVNLQHVLMTNGYSNIYWGWGGEDDDLWERFQHLYIPIVRPSPEEGVFRMLKHRKSQELPSYIRSQLLRTAVERFRMDGLNSWAITNDTYHYKHYPVGVKNPFSHSALQHHLYVMETNINF